MRALLLGPNNIVTGGGPKNFYVGKLSYGLLYWDSAFRYSKVIRRQALLHDAAGAVGSQTGKRPGYCYMINRGPFFCLIT